MTRKLSAAAALAASFAAASCHKLPTDGAGYCTAVAIAGIYVNVQDRLTDTPPPFVGLWARAVDGTYKDSSTMSFTNSQTGVVSIPLAYERVGTYAVTVHADGYENFVRTGVVVVKDDSGCHVEPVEIVARLVKP